MRASDLTPMHDASFELTPSERGSNTAPLLHPRSQPYLQARRTRWHFIPGSTAEKNLGWAALPRRAH